MIFTEIVALIAILAGGSIGVSFVVSHIRRMNHMDDLKIEHSGRMARDLRDALQSRDHRRLDDWLVIYSDADPDVRLHVQSRRDVLYTEENL